MKMLLFENNCVTWVVIF